MNDGNDIGWQNQNQITLQAEEIETTVTGSAPETRIRQSPPNMNVIENSDYIFRAEQRITLQNFHVEYGNRFQATIASCVPFTTECGFNYAPPRLAASQSQILSEKESPFQIYPNPTSGKVIIESNIPFTWKLFDAYSNLLMTSGNIPLKKDGLSIVDSPSGVYFLILETESDYYTHKIHKQP